MELFSLKGKLAVITGGGSGIGRAISAVFAQAGAHVAILDVDAAGAAETLAMIEAAGGSAEFLSCNVAAQAEVDQALETLMQRHARLDVWINNAGVSHVGSIETTSEADLDRIYSINVKGVYNGSRAAVRQMTAQHAAGAAGGVILNMASIASLIGVEQRFAYSMSKGAVLTMTMSVAVDYVKQGIRCNCICPARVHTPFVDGFLKKNYPGKEQEMFEKLAAYQPIGRMGKPEEVAWLALYLCSDEASFITGQAYPLDGGVLVF